MKKFLFISVIFGFLGISYGYQQQGFTSYQEDGQMINFTCEQQCIILLGPRGTADNIHVSGLEGQGQVVAGMLIDNSQVASIAAPEQVHSQVDFLVTTAGGHPIPADAQMALIFQGKISAKNGNIGLTQRSLGQKWAGYRDSFWTNEPLRPYSINLRYGIKLGSSSLVSVVYWIAFLGTILIFLFGKQPTEKKWHFLTFWLFLIVLFTLRNLRNRTDRTKIGLETYTNAPETQKSFYDLGDYPVFITKMRNVLELDKKFGQGSCTIFFDAFQDRPFKVHADSVYSRPCEPATDKVSADYIVYYKKPIGPESQGKSILLEFNDSFLVRTH